MSLRAVASGAVSGGGSGDVVGPASSTLNAIARYADTTGKLLRDSSGATVSDNFALTLAGATVTASEPVLNLTQTWNNGAVVFTGARINVTNTASAAGSLLWDVQVGGVTAFNVTRTGGVAFPGNLSMNGTAGAQATLASGTVTASAPPLTVTQTWNNAGVTFSGALVNITNTASAATSNLLDLQVGGTSVFNVNRAGEIWGSNTANRIIGNTGSSSPQIAFATSGTVTLRSSANGVVLIGNTNAILVFNATTTTLTRPAAGQLELVGATQAQTYRVYRTYTDTSNYERQALQSGAGYFEWAAETAGTGTDDIDLRLTPSTTTAAVDFRNPANGAGAGAGTITNAPSAGNPAYWLKIKIAGTVHYIPAWT